MALFQKAPKTAAEAAQWGPLALGPDKVKDMTEAEWYAKIYRGPEAPQLTWRAVLMGSLLGFALAFTNLYVGLKTGWGLGVAITACILSFAIWNALLAFKLARSPMTILENNCMQSTASSAGYATGGTVVSAITALLMIQGHHLPWHVLAMWTFFLGILGTALAIPMKRNMINRERLPFPSGLAAATTLQSLYSDGAEALRKAKALLWAAVVGALFPLLTQLPVKETPEGKTGLLPEHLHLFDFLGWGKNRADQSSYKASDWFVAIENSPVMVAAGALMGLRTTIWMLVSATVLAFALGPWGLGQEWQNPAGELKYAVSIPQKAWREVGLWLGAPILVSSGLLLFALQWKTIVAALRPPKQGAGEADRLVSDTEVPSSWMWALVAFGGGGTVIVAHEYFSIPWHLGVLAIVMTFFLSLVACRATGETDITPIGAMGKVMQLTYGVLIKQNAVSNLMSASVTANAAGSSADLLNDLKAGYLLGANPRRQFIAQLLGVITGTVATTWGFYLLVPSADVLLGDSAKYPAPAAASWKAVADVFQFGIANMHATHRTLMFWGLGLGALFVLLEHFFPQHKKLLPSASGVGLGLILPFFNPLSMFLGALIAFFWEKKNREMSERYLVPVVAGLIAGAALMGVVVTILSLTVLA